VFPIIALHNLDKIPTHDNGFLGAYEVDTDKRKAATELLRLLGRQSPQLSDYMSAQVTLSTTGVSMGFSNTVVASFEQGLCRISIQESASETISDRLANYSIGEVTG
jgi:hypothetical protein